MTHTVVLTWQDLLNPAGSVFYNVYRAAGAGATSGFVKIASQLSAKTYTDADPALAIGNYTYYVTSLELGVESVPSASLTVGIGPAAPTGLTGAAS